MYCTKCGKEIPDGEKRVCEDCEKNLLNEIVSEEKNETEKVEITKKEKVKKEKVAKKEKKTKEVKDAKNEAKAERTTGDWKVSKGPKANKEKKGIPFVACLLIVIVVVGLAIGIYKLAANTVGEVGNTIGNIRNYGYAAEQNGWIYYLSPNEDSSKIGIYRIKNNGKDIQELYMGDIDIVSLNVYGDYIYFIGSGMSAYTEDDEVDNKIYRMKKTGSELEILNDNELNNECYEIYVLDDSIYYIGLNAEICKMDLDGANKTTVVDNKTGYLGITEKYIIYNMPSEDGGYITYIMNRDGSEPRPIVEGKRLYSVNIEDNYVYYTDVNKKFYRTEIGSNVEEKLYEDIEAYNLNTNGKYAYYLNYLDAENEDYTVAVFKVKLDGTSEAPENIKQLDTYSSYIDIVGDWVIYMDSNSDSGFINLVKLDGSGEAVQLYNLDYEAYYEQIQEQDYSDTPVDTNGSNTNTTDVTNTVIENPIGNTVNAAETNTVNNETTPATNTAKQ